MLAYQRLFFTSHVALSDSRDERSVKWSGDDIMGGRSGTYGRKVIIFSLCLFNFL